MNYKIAQIELNTGQSSGQVFVSQTDKEKEETAGKLFILAQIDKDQAGGSKIIDFLVKDLAVNYYHNEKIILKEKISSLAIEHIFEAALAKTNKNFVNYLKETSLEFDPDNLSISIGIVYNSELHFTSLGKTKNLLIYKDRKDNSYKLTDILKKSGKADEEKKEINLAKLFSAIVSGAIPDDGYFLVANEALTEYLSPRQLTEIISTLPPASAAEQIKNNLSSINSYIPFFGLIIKNTLGQVPDRLPDIKPATSQESIRELNTTERTTEKYLESTGAINVGKKINAGKWLALLGSGAQKMIGRAEVPKKTLFIKDKIFVGRKTYLGKLSRFSKTAAYAAKQISGRLASGLSKLSYAKTKDSVVSSGKGAQSAFKSALSWIKNLKLIHKASFAVVGLCLMLLAGNLYLDSRKQQAEEAIRKNQETIVLIEQKINKIDASLLYNNNDMAGQLYIEANELIAQLPAVTEEEVAVINKLKTEIQEKLDKISKITTVENIETIADLSVQNSGAAPIGISKLGTDSLFVADSQTKSASRINLSSREVTKLTADEGIINEVSWPSSNDPIIYFFNRDNILRYDTESDSFMTLAFRSAIDSGQIAAMGVFSNRFYLVNTAANQIHRYERRGQSLTDPTAWLKSETNLAGARDIAIDGRIYILKAASLSVYANGESEAFSLDSVLPSLKNASRLDIPDNSKFIYILDPAEKRVLVFDKDGHLITQYRSESFTDLKDLTIDEASKKAYLLNGASVIAFDISHL